jgi:hypothetical protein
MTFSKREYSGHGTPWPVALIFGILLILFGRDFKMGPSTIDIRWFGVIILLFGLIGFYVDRENVKEFYKKIRG